ncbi:MAG TPA: FAD-dependent oxidoreductase [Candidatus Saccharimonadales bacterium]|nr:FAD-dependent oxidoreductase [Candidatus Saccharimonadales bacterium]
MNATLDHIEDIAPNIKTFWFNPVHPVQYTAGQFIELHLPHPNPDQRGQRRWFTLSSSPTEGPLIGITTRFATDHNSTSKQTLRALQVGTSVSMTEPMGDFVLPKDASLPLLFVAGGMGITPIRSIIKYLYDTRERRSIQLLYGVHHADELVFAPLFEAYTMQFTPVAKESAAGWKGEVGRLTPERILKEANCSKGTLIYLSGPEPMVEAFDKALKDNGIDKHRIITDFFPGYPAF